MGAPGCPEFACCTASIARVRKVLILRVSSCWLESNVCSVATIERVSFGRLDQTVAGRKLSRIRQFTKLWKSARGVEADRNNTFVDLSALRGYAVQEREPHEDTKVHEE